ncbi:WD40-repeat-containing domain protein [Dipodascopsis uninucleata]
MIFYRSKLLELSGHSITSLAFSHKSSAKAVDKANPKATVNGEPNSVNFSEKRINGWSTSADESFTPKSLRLAVGRANGDIEIWNPRYNWVHEKTIKGGRNRSIEGLAWSTDCDTGALRLFSIGGSTTVTEWDLSTGLPIEHYDCNAGIIWSIAVSPDGNKIASGCDDGSVVIADISGGRGSIVHSKILQRQKSRVLSITWRGNNQIVGGCADGRIRIWTIGSTDTGEGAFGRVVSMRVDKAAGEETLVWSVLTLNDGKTIVSGDSTGSIKFWDAQRFSLLQSFEVHEADVLSLAANFVGDTVFSAGVDRKIVKYSIVDPKLRRWANMSSRLLHSQDIRALAAYEAKGSSYLISGGVEKTIVINSVDNFIDGVFRKISVSPQHSCMQIVGSKRLVPVWSDNKVKVWSIEKFSLPATHDSQQHHQVPFHVTPSELKTRKLVASLSLNNEENITYASLSSNAKFLAISTNSETKLFRLIPANDGSIYKVKKINAPELLEQGALTSSFDTQNENLVLVNPESDVLVYPLSGEASIKEFIPSMPQNQKEIVAEEEPIGSKSLSQAVPYLDNICSITFSDDGHYMATATTGGKVQIYDWNKKSYLWTTPKLSSPSVVMKFGPDNDSLLVITTQMKILQFSVQDQALTPWARKNNGRVPRELSNLVDKCSGAAFIPDDTAVENNIDTDENTEGQTNELWIWGVSWFANLDITNDIEPVLRIPKRKRQVHVSIDDTRSETTNGVYESRIESKSVAVNGNGTATVSKINGVGKRATQNHFETSSPMITRKSRRLSINTKENGVHK